ncbi:hypothetical protein F5Y15DRAFT_402341 [Xylariaceae sp. FL0016]|nr:hypothetical protein F5Y15DRAFT_402341 [Xylariaceae sp. FL0016]
MPLLKKFTLAVACLASIATAKPINSARLATCSSDCAPGLIFYNCANGACGCYPSGVDPCTTTTTTTSATPSPTNTDPVTIREPKMWTLYPGNPDAEDGPTTGLNLVRRDNGSVNEGLAVFAGIPAGAKQCMLGWVQAPLGERDFTVTDNGLATFRQLPGMAEGVEVTAATVAPYVLDAGREISMDFTYWDKQQEGAATHGGGEVECAETIYVQASINADGGDGSIFFEQDFQNGLEIRVEV